MIITIIIKDLFIIIIYIKTNKCEDFYNWLLSKSYNIDCEKLIKR